MFSKNFIYTLLVLLSVCLTSCKKDNENTTPTGTGNISFEFDNVVGSSQLVLDSTMNTFTNSSGEKFSITQFNYYISNIRLKKSDGTTYVVPQDSSYFLIMESNEESQMPEIHGVPAGDYKEITFTIGVDSLRSTMDISKRTGVLDPAYLSGHGMYWSWNQGYIFLKAEGMSPSAPEMMGHEFYYHIGGFGGYSSQTINNIRTITLPLPGEGATVRSNINPELHILVDVLKIFDGPKPLKIAENSMVMWSDVSLDISNNYKNMFTVHHIHNEP